MDNKTWNHLQRWLWKYEDGAMRARVEDDIFRYLARDPDAIERGLSWPEIRDRGAALAP